MNTGEKKDPDYVILWAVAIRQVAELWCIMAKTSQARKNQYQSHTIKKIPGLNYFAFWGRAGWNKKPWKLHMLLS